MSGLYDGVCHVCGGHIYGLINNTVLMSQIDWTCLICGATRDKPVFNPDRKISYNIICYKEKICKGYRTEKCLHCNKCTETEFPKVTLNGEKADIEKEIINGLTYKQLAEQYNSVELYYLSYTCETRFIFNNPSWEILYEN